MPPPLQHATNRDVHHGNGTQDIFFDDARVLTVSVHRRDKSFYPVGVGYAKEVGEAAGAGFNVNVGWPARGFGDADYLVGPRTLACLLPLQARACVL